MSTLYPPVGGPTRPGRPPFSNPIRGGRWVRLDLRSKPDQYRRELSPTEVDAEYRVEFPGHRGGGHDLDAGLDTGLEDQLQWIDRVGRPSDIWDRI